VSTDPDETSKANASQPRVDPNLDIESSIDRLLANRWRGDEFDAGPDVPQENETEIVQFPEPVTHQVDGAFVVSSLSLYEAVSSLFDQRSEEDSNSVKLTNNYNPAFVEGMDSFGVTLKASDWLAGRFSDEGEYNPASKYSLRLSTTGDAQPAKKAVKLAVTLEPQDPSLMRKNGNPFSCPYGKGTRVRVQTSYVSCSEDLRNRAYELLRKMLDCDPASDDIVEESKRVWRLESYVRVNKSRKEHLKTAIDITEYFLPGAGSPETPEKLLRDIESYLWSDLGFWHSEDRKIRLKLYDSKLGEDAPGIFGHPKLEAILQKCDGEKPHWREFESILSTLREIVVAHCIAAGITPDELFADSFYKGSKAQTKTWEVPNIREKRLRRTLIGRVNKLHRLINYGRRETAFDVLDAISQSEISGVEYKDIVEETGLSKSSIRKYIKRFSDNDICYKRGNPIVVQFQSKAVWKIFQLLAEDIRPDLPDTREKRAERRRRRREED